ncbi:LysM peptidoglycan-binding domain-containing protein [bacterium]|nr:LysM peptidoglycan-binding domain-containing protein [bacterium]
MDRSVKILLAASVLLAGTSLAMLFRRPAPEAARPVQPAGDPLVFRERIGPQTSVAPADRPTVRIEARATDVGSLAGQLPTILKPLDPGPPPPDLARSYPGTSAAADPHWQPPPARDVLKAPSSQGSSRSHKIVDGDTLARIADRYLGDASRWPEVFQANQELLSSPELLPIGAVLKIPSHAAKPSDPSAAPAGKRLIPLPSRASENSACVSDCGPAKGDSGS